MWGYSFYQGGTTVNTTAGVLYTNSTGGSQGVFIHSFTMHASGYIASTASANWGVMQFSVGTHFTYSTRFACNVGNELNVHLTFECADAEFQLANGETVNVLYSLNNTGSWTQFGLAGTMTAIIV